MSLLPWWAWIILAGVLALAEMHVPGSYLVWIALGAAIAGAAHAAFGAPLEGQIAVFVAASAASCLAGYFVYRGLGLRRRGVDRLNQRNLAMLGERGMVCEAFVNGRGKVRVGDSVWLADGPDLAEGTAIVVGAVRGTRLVVEPARARSGSG